MTQSGQDRSWHRNVLGMERILGRWREEAMEVEERCYRGGGCMGNVSRGNWPELRMGVARGRGCDQGRRWD